MSWRARMIQNVVDNVGVKADDILQIEIEVEHQESAFHTFSDLNEYKDVLIVMIWQLQKISPRNLLI